MQKILLIGTCAVMSVLCANAQSGRFTLNGELKDYSGWIFFSYGSIPDGVLTIDSTEVRDGRFAFTGEIPQPLQATVFTNPGFDPGIRFYIEPGIMNFNGSLDDRDNYTLTGSVVNDQARARARQAEPYIPELMTLRGGTLTEEEKEARMKRVHEFIAIFKQMDIAFIESYPDSYYSAAILRSGYGQSFTREELEKYYSTLTPRVRESYDGKAVASFIAGDQTRIGEAGRRLYAQLEANKLRSLKLDAGNPAPEITGTDINGENFRLSGLRGKYVILDFWGSWCAPCRRGNPHMIELYGKYHGKGLEFVFIAEDDNTQDKWREAVETDGIGMFHHILSQGATVNIPGKYNVTAFPTKFLVDQKGNLIGKFETPELNAKLTEIFDF